MKFRVVGDCSFGWVEAVASWGGRLDTIVHRKEDNHPISEAFNDLPPSISASQVLASTPAGISFDGVLLATICDKDDALCVEACFLQWQPLIAIIVLPSLSSRKERALWTQFGNTRTFQATYHRRGLHCIHNDIGGVTPAS